MERRTINSLLPLTLILLLFAACTGNKHEYQIGVSQCSQGRWRDKVNNEMLAAQHLYEQDVKVIIANSYDDTERQIRQIDSLAASGIDLLVVSPNEAAPLRDAIARVRERGIPVVFFDRKAETDDYAAFIGGNNEEAGKAVGEYAVSVAQGMVAEGRRPLVLEVTAAMSTTPARERHQGFAQAMSGHTELEYICREGDWTSDAACDIVTEQIKTGRLPDIVFCHNDGMATGAYKAVVETKTEGKIKILGIDGMPGEGLEYVQFGHQIGTYIYPTHGERIVRLALDILTGKPYEKENALQGILVTPDNVNSIAATSNVLMEQNTNLVTIQDKLEAYLGLYHTQRKVLIASLICIALLAIAVVMAWRAHIQTRRTIRQRQQNNEEQTLFYISPTHRKLRQVFEAPEPDTPPVRSQDAIFAETLNEAIRQNMSNPALKMEDLGDAVGLSRVQLYRKVKAITGLSPVELLRQMRLQRGYTLIQTTTKTINEIAYEVGFNTPSYFSKCFHEQYGKYPTEVRSEQN